MSRNLLLERRAVSKDYVNPQHLLRKGTLKTFGQTGQVIGWSCEYLSVQCIWLHVIIKSHACSRVNPDSVICLDIKALLARSRSHIWSLSNSKEIWTQNRSVRKRTLNYWASLAKWLSRVVSIYLYVALTVWYFYVTYEFHSESALFGLPQCRGTHCSKQVAYLKFKWQEWDLNP